MSLAPLSPILVIIFQVLPAATKEKGTAGKQKNPAPKLGRSKLSAVPPKLCQSTNSAAVSGFPVWLIASRFKAEQKSFPASSHLPLAL